MSLDRLLPRKRNPFAYEHQLSKRILKAGRWRAALREQAEKYGDGRIDEGFKLAHLLIGGTWLWLIASIFFAGILHIVAVLFLPERATESGWVRISKLTPVNKIMVLPSGMAGQEVLPRLAPDVRYAFCRYTLEKGPVKFTVPMASDLWTVSIHNSKGDNFYTISGADVQRGEASFIISHTPDNLILNPSKPARKQENLFKITSAPMTGLVVIRAPLQGTAHAAFTDSLINRASCGPGR